MKSKSMRYHLSVMLLKMKSISDKSLYLNVFAKLDFIQKWYISSVIRKRIDQFH